MANKEAGIEPKKMAYGGETNPQKETVKSMENNPTAGFADGGEVSTPTDEEMAQATGGQSFSNPLAFLANLPSINQTAGLPTSPQQPQVDNDFIHKLNMGTALTPPPPTQPAVNPISQAAQTMNNTPPTSPDIYSGIGAPDRAALANQLLAQKATPGAMVTSGAGGLADAITSAFGKQPTNFQGNIRNTQTQNAAQRLGIVDTQRQQVLQDIQAKIAVQESDPNSPYSQGMRQFLNAQGMKVPSGMSAAMLKQTLPDVTKIFDAKMQTLTAQGAQGVEAGKALMGETFADWLKEQLGVGGAEQGEDYLAKRVGGTTSAANTGGWKVVR